jgi:hypothetical protein
MDTWTWRLSSFVGAFFFQESLHLVLYYLATVLVSSLVWYCTSWQLFWYSSVFVLHYQANVLGFLLFGAALPDDCPGVPPCLVLRYLAAVLLLLCIWFCITWRLSWVPPYLVLHKQATFTGFHLVQHYLATVLQFNPIWCCTTWQLSCDYSVFRTVLPGDCPLSWGSSVFVLRYLATVL